MAAGETGNREVSRGLWLEDILAENRAEVMREVAPGGGQIFPKSHFLGVPLVSHGENRLAPS